MYYVPRYCTVFLDSHACIMDDESIEAEEGAQVGKWQVASDK